MTKKNLIIVIILLAIIDLVAAGWYMSRSYEVSGKSPSLFDYRDSTEVVAMADTLVTTYQADEFDKLQHNSYYFVSNSPAVPGDESSRYTSIKHAKVKWPKSVNGNDDLADLNKELIRAAFGNSQSNMKDARYVFLNNPTFNRPLGDDEYHSQVTAPHTHPVYGNVSQVMVYPYMTSLRLLVMEIDKQEYNGSTTIEGTTSVHYDRLNQRVLSRVDILQTDMEKESKLLKLINRKIDELNKSRSDENRLQHALNVPAEIRCNKTGILFMFKHGAISNSPIEILIDYEQLKPFMTKDFEQLVDNNGKYMLYKDKPKAEPVNPTTAVSKPKPAPVMSPALDQGSSYKKSYKKSYHKGYKKSYRNGYNNGYKRSGDNSSGDKQSNYYKKSGSKRSGYKKSGYKKSGGTQSSFTPTQTNQKQYSGAKRKSGRYGYAGRRRWSRRQR